MKIRDSGMPEEVHWETLFDRQEIIDVLSRDGGWLDRSQSHAIEFGCGHGTFTELLGDHFTDRVDSFDLDPRMISRTQQRIGSQRKHIHLHQLDFLSEPWPAESRGAHTAVLFHMMHLAEPAGFLRQVAAHLSPGGQLAILHWRPDQATPRGPDLKIRPTRGQLEDWAALLGAKSITHHSFDQSVHHIAATIRLP